MRASHINPRLSAWAQLEGIFDFNKTPLAPPGMPVVFHEQTGQRQSWGAHGLDGFYLGPALEHYRCYRTYISHTKGIRTGDTVEFLPSTFRIPHLATKDHAIIAARELATALTKPLPAGPFQVSDEHLAAIRQLSAIFSHTTTPEPQPAPAAPPRVPINPPETHAAPLRVPIPSSSIPPPALPPPALPNPPLTATPTSPPRQPKRHTSVVTPPRNHPEATPRPANMLPDLPIHCYNTRSQPTVIPNQAIVTHQPITAQTSQTSGMTFARTRSWTTSAGQALLAKIIAKDNMMPRSFQPMIANHVIDESTGKILQYRDLIKMPDKVDVWTRSFANELGCLAQGVGDRLEGTNTIFFINYEDMSKDRKATYGRIVVDICPQKAEVERTRLTVGGNLIDFPGDVSAKVADITTAKLLFNSVISTPGAKFMGIDIKKIYLGTPME